MLKTKQKKPSEDMDDSWAGLHKKCGNLWHQQFQRGSIFLKIRYKCGESWFATLSLTLCVCVGVGVEMGSVITNQEVVPLRWYLACFCHLMFEPGMQVIYSFINYILTDLNFLIKMCRNTLLNL